MERGGIELANQGCLFGNKSKMNYNSSMLNNLLGIYYLTLKKQCDNCSKELSKFTFFNSERKIYRYNNAMLCRTCFEEIKNSHRQQLEEEQQQPQ